MPLIHISLRAGKPEAYRQAIFDGLYRALRETLSVPEDDQFMTITEHDAANFRTGDGYGVARSADVIYSAPRPEESGERMFGMQCERRKCEEPASCCEEA